MTDVPREVRAWIEEHDDFVIASHLDPDGDSLGSSLALTLALAQVGKRSVPVLAQPLPDRYTWLPGSDLIVSRPQPPEDCAAVILVECSDFARSGLDGLERLPSLNVDHHARNARYASVDWIDPGVAAVGQMVGDLIEALGAEIDADMARLLYVTVLTDTGSFRHSNTDADALAFAARMVTAGADAAVISERIFGDYPESRVRLMAEALATLTLEDGGRIAWMAIPLETFERVGTRDTEDVINQAQGIAGVAVSLLLKEAEKGAVRVSMRSDGSVDVAEIAVRHGGGGHPRAAGCQLRMSLEEARQVLLDDVRGAPAGGDR